MWRNGGRILEIILINYTEKFNTTLRKIRRTNKIVGRRNSENLRDFARNKKNDAKMMKKIREN